MTDDGFRSMLLHRGMVKRLHALSRGVLGGELKQSQLEDLVQAALVAAWERRASFRGTKEAEFIGWFLAIVRHRAIDEARRRRLEPLLLGETLLLEASADAPSPEHLVRNDAEYRNVLERGLSRLGKVERAIVELVFRYNMPLVEVATLLGMEVARARRAQMKAVQKLKRFAQAHRGKSWNSLMI